MHNRDVRIEELQQAQDEFDPMWRGERWSDIYPKQAKELKELITLRDREITKRFIR